MRGGNNKQPNSRSSSLKVILISCSFLLLFLFLLIIRSTVSNSSSLSNQEPKQQLMSAAAELECPNGNGNGNSNSSNSNSYLCNKIPASLAHALVHYVTSNITPQQTVEEISVSLRVLLKKSPCNFLVFGLGHDSLMWASLNHGGRTVFLEEDKSWIDKITAQNPSLESYHVQYHTKRTEADKLHDIGMQQHCKAVSDPRMSKCELSLKGLPDMVYETEWDVIMVDAPTGYHDEAPGRMSAIYTAGVMGRNRENGGETDVFVHDVDRMVEDKFSKSFLCEGYMVEQQGRIRHFNIPSHAAPGTPFCPDD